MMSIETTASLANGKAEDKDVGPEPFSQTLTRHNCRLVREQTHTLQVNLGLLCNQVCRHCHLEAGPDRKEIMNRQTAGQVIAYARRAGFETVDITGGAPELNDHLAYLIEGASPFARRIMLRSNLSALDENWDPLANILAAHRVVVVASFPSINLHQTDSQRGQGIFDKSIKVLKRLNAMGYGQPGSGLELDLVSNPTGAFLPPSQDQAAKRYHQVLADRWGVVFNQLFNFANVPLGRFRRWLHKSGNLQSYLARLAANFNPCAVEGLMCRTLVSVNWDGYLFDCDFNLAKGLFMGARRIHVAEMSGPPSPASPIATADHCYTCTAGTGFT